MEKQQFMKIEQAKEIMRGLAKSQGFYGRLLQAIENATEEQIKELELDFELNKVKDSLDLVLYFET